MAILTESKIKKLLRTTELKETKYLVLEPGTVITPSAKEYLKDITIEYVEMTEESRAMNQEITLPTGELKIDERLDSKGIQELLIYKDANGQEIWKSQLIYQFKIKIDLIISRILTLQKKSQHVDDIELIESLNRILMIIKTIPIDALALDKMEMVEEIVKIVEDKRPYAMSLYPESIFIPDYKEEECVIALFELHAYLQELEHFIAKEMKDSLRFENYINYISIMTVLREYSWILMIQSKENSIE